jgi:hypothetical protein
MHYCTMHCGALLHHALLLTMLRWLRLPERRALCMHCAPCSVQ